MSKLDDIIWGIPAGATEFADPSSVTEKGSEIAIGPATAKGQIKSLILEVIGEDDPGESRYNAERHRNGLRFELRSKVESL